MEAARIHIPSGVRDTSRMRILSQDPCYHARHINAAEMVHEDGCGLIQL